MTPFTTLFSDVVHAIMFPQASHGLSWADMFNINSLYSFVHYTSIGSDEVDATVPLLDAVGSRPLSSLISGVVN